MERYRRIQIISWLIVAVAFIGLAIWLLFGVAKRGGGFISSSIQALNGPYKEKGRYSIDATAIDQLDFNWIAGDIIVTPYDGSDIEMIEYAPRDLKEDEVVYYDIDSSTLIIRYCKQDTFVHSLPTKKLEIMLPKELAKNLQELTLKTTSSTVKISDITTKKCHISSVSGDGKISNVVTDNLTVQSTSGNHVLTNVTAAESMFKSVSGELSTDNFITDNLEVMTTSGNVSFEDLNVKKLSFHSISGDLRFNGSVEDILGETTSGNMLVTDEIAPKSFRYKSISGDIYLTMPELEDFVLHHKSISGDLESDIPVKTSKNENETYSIKTTSGNAVIKALEQDTEENGAN